jgi:hypothetical protein
MKEIPSELLLKLDNLISVLTPPSLLNNLDFYSTILLTITLGFLIWYTIETHKLSKQAKDTNLRPIILRSGTIEKWDSLEFPVDKNNNLLNPPLIFEIQKNIATSITGYVIKNNKKHILIFSHEVAQKGNKSTFFENWGWVKENSRLSSIFVDTGTQTSEKNKIVINYKDVEGNKYHTIEDINFDQKSFKGSKK